MTLQNSSISFVRTSDSVLGSPDGQTVQGPVNVALNQLLENDVGLNERISLLQVQVASLMGASNPGGGGEVLGIPFYQSDKDIIYSNEADIDSLYNSFSSYQNANESAHLGIYVRLSALESANPGQPYNITIDQLAPSLVSYIDSNSGGSSPIPEGSFTPAGGYPVNTASDMSAYVAGQSYWTANSDGQAGGSFNMLRGDWLLWNGGTAGTDADWTFVSQGGSSGGGSVDPTPITIPYSSISRVHLAPDLWFPFWQEDTDNYALAIKDLNDSVAFGIKNNGEIAGVTSLEIGVKNGLSVVKDFANLKDVINFGAVEGIVPLANHTLDGNASEMPFAIVDRDNYSPFYITDNGGVYVHGASFEPEPEHSLTVIDQNNNILFRVDGAGVFVPVWHPDTQAIGGVDLSAVNATLNEHDGRLDTLEGEVSNLEATLNFTVPGSLIDIPRNINRTIASFTPSKKITTVVIGDSFVSGDLTAFSGFTSFSWYGLCSADRDSIYSNPLGYYKPSKEIPPVSFVHNRGLSYELALSMGGLLTTGAGIGAWNTDSTSLQDIADSFNLRNSQVGCRYPVKDKDGAIYYGVQPSSSTIKTLRSGDIANCGLLPAFVSVSLSSLSPASIYNTITGIKKNSAIPPSNYSCIDSEYLFGSFFHYDGVSEKIKQVGRSYSTVSDSRIIQPPTTGLFLGERGLDYIMENIPNVNNIGNSDCVTSCLYTFDVIQNAHYFPPFYNSVNPAPLPTLRFFVQKTRSYVPFATRKLWQIPLPIFSPVASMTGDVDNVNAPKADNSQGSLMGVWSHITGDNITRTNFLIRNLTKGLDYIDINVNLENDPNISDGDVLEITLKPSWSDTTSTFANNSAAAYYIGVPFMPSYLEHYFGVKFLGYEVVPASSEDTQVERIISQGRSGGVLHSSNPVRLPATGNSHVDLNTTNANEPFDPRCQFGSRVASNGTNVVFRNVGSGIPGAVWDIRWQSIDDHTINYKEIALRALDIQTFAILGGANETYNCTDSVSAEAAATLFIRSFFGYVSWYRQKISHYTDFVLIGQLPLHNENSASMNTYHGIGINRIYQKMLNILADSDTLKTDVLQHSIGLFSLVRHLQFINSHFESSALHPTSEVTMALNKSFNLFLEQ